MLLELNPQSGIPLYRQIVDQIQRMVAGGQLRPGHELPSVREVAGRYAINPMTVSKAYSQLESMELVERRRGKPMRISSRADAADSLDRRLERLSPELDRLIAAARQLGIPSARLLEVIRELMEDSDHD